MRSLRWILGISIAAFLIFLVASAGVFLWQSKIAKKDNSANLFEKNKDSVGLIEIKGVITDSKKTIKQLEEFSENSHVKAVVLRLDTPGGVVGPSQEIYEKVKNFPKPVVVSMGSVAASGGYYIAAGAKKIFANPGTITGSVGVIFELLNLKKFYEWAKVERYALTSGKFKGSGAEYKELSPDERALYQGMINDVMSQFKAAVKEGRKLSDQEMEIVSDGRIFSGSQAKAIHLVDELGGQEAAVLEAAKMAKIEGKPEVVYPDKKKKDWFDFILQNAGDDESEAESLSGKFAHAVADSLLHSLKSDVGVSEPFLTPGLYLLWKP